MIKELYKLTKNNKGKTGETTQTPTTSSQTEDEEELPKDRTIVIESATGHDEENKWKKVKEELEKIRKEQIDMARELQEMNKSVKSVEKNTTEIKETMPTYAQVLTNTNRKPVEVKNQSHTMTEQHTVIVASKEDMDTGDHVLNKIRTTLNAKAEGLCIQRASKIRNSKVVLSCATEREIKMVKEKLEKEGALIVETAKNKDPLIKIPGLMDYNKEEDIVLSLKNQNKKLWEDMKPSDFQIKELYRIKARNPLQCSVIMKVSPQVHARLLAAGKVYVDMQLLAVYDHSPIRQCSRCLGFGHGRRHCTEPADICCHCGGAHVRAQCTAFKNGTAPSCKNCTAEKRQNVEHNAFSEDCPVWQRWDRIARAGINYLC